MPYKDPIKRKEYHKKYGSEWQKRKREHRRLYLKNFYSIPENRQKRNEKVRKWKEKNKERLLIAHRKYNEENREKIRERHNKRNKELRLTVLNHYGKKCICCRETEEKFLSIDHINGGGNKHRKIMTMNFYAWLIKNDFPKGFQILCYNCNFSKGHYGQCPHQSKIKLCQ